MHSLVLLVHIGIVCASALLVLYADEQALLWFLGKKSTLDAARIHKLHIALGICLFLLVATGTTLFWPMRAYLFTLPQFYVKMTLVFALLINGFCIEFLSKHALKRPFKALSSKERIPLILSGAVSGLGWVGAIICGLLLT